VARYWADGDGKPTSRSKRRTDYWCIERDRRRKRPVSLAGLGAKVALVARCSDRLQELAAQLTAGGATAVVITADVTKQAEAERAVEQTVSRLGRLDTLINNAGVMLLGPVIDAPVEEWERMVQINLLGLLYCTHAALPHLLGAAENSPRRVADLVNISSVAGRETRSGSGVYEATKHGVGAFSDALRKETPRATSGCRWSNPARQRPSSPRTTGPRSSAHCSSALGGWNASPPRTSAM
jgi:NADP-dependent 3-hydroxy acid dehydrogenase YdfG